MPFSRTFTETEIMAMAGYQLDPGHSDLYDEQSMSVRLHDGLWDHQDMRCLLGDIRQAKTDVRALLKLPTALRERADWLRKEYLNGGVRAHLEPREEEARAIADMIERGRFA